MVEEDQLMVSVMTDKATVELTAPVSGKVMATHGAAGAMVVSGRSVRKGREAICRHESLLLSCSVANACWIVAQVAPPPL